MSKYTVYEQPWIDQQIQKQIDFAVEKINQKIKGVESIILVGGFGRGEGSVKLINQEMTPLNDYDIYVVLSAGLKITEAKSMALMNEIEKDLGTSGFSLYESSTKSYYFDIRFINLSQLKNVGPFIKYYEMKHASYILSGKDVRSLIPDYQVNDLPISESLRFVFNRLSSISLWTPIDLIIHKDIPEWQKDAILYDISKSYIEICTALTQLAGVYSPTYRQRADNLKKIFNQNFSELEKDCPNLLEKIDYYTNLKLKPEYQLINNHLERWFETRNDLLKAIAFILKKSFNVGSQNFVTAVCRNYFKPYLSKVIEKRLKIKNNRWLLGLASFLAQLYLNLVWFFRVIKFRKKIYFRILLDYKDPGIKIFNSLVLIIKGLNNDGTIRVDDLKNGLDILKEIYPTTLSANSDLENFRQVINLYINTWKLYYFQKIV